MRIKYRIALTHGHQVSKVPHQQHHNHHHTHECFYDQVIRRVPMTRKKKSQFLLRRFGRPR
jgi:hypothetical protein